MKHKKRTSTTWTESTGTTLVIWLFFSLLLIANAGAQSITSIVFQTSCQLRAVVTNGTILLTDQPDNGIIASFGLHPDPFGSGNPLAVETGGDVNTGLFSYSPLHTPLTNWMWDFGDGSPIVSDGRFPCGEFTPHLYSTEGVYTITGTFTDSGGFKKSLSHTFSIPLPPDQPSNFFTLTAQKQPDGSLMLYSSPNVGGPWSIMPTGQQQFYKLAPK